MYRTNKLNELRIADCGKTVTLSGWVSTIRNLGSFAFIDLRDRYGITQILVKDDLTDLVKDIKNEYVLKVTGLVQERSSKNPKLDTGDIEVLANSIEVLSKSKALPFEINDEEVANESLRLKYRYLDLRKPRMLNNIIKRNTMLFSMREFLNQNGFLDIDTPVLAKATPEGARDFIVPSRIQ
ncbi:amino acid--tRNA ligase-related protein, partial [uncultured Sneathia sp.]